LVVGVLRQPGVAAADALHGLAQLADVLLGEGVQGPLDGGLLGHALASEGSGKGHVRAHPCVRLVDGLAPRKHAHECVRELLGGGVFDRLLVDLHARKGLECPLLGKEVSQGAKAPEGGLPLAGDESTLDHGWRSSLISTIAGVEKRIDRRPALVCGSDANPRISREN
jgi:hypothetical protein